MPVEPSSIEQSVFEHDYSRPQESSELNQLRNRLYPPNAMPQPHAQRLRTRH